MDTLTLEPIGFIRTDSGSGGDATKFQALHQPQENDASHRSILELLPDPRYQAALRDLEGFSRIWLLWWFHKNDTWRPTVMPPRGPQKRRGVFATRSPYRPSPLGLTPVQLLRIEGRRLHLGPCDAIDGTPVFDIRPYIPDYDSFPNERTGWIAEVNAQLALPPSFAVTFTALAEQQAEWLSAQWQIDFRPRLCELLSRDPTPHRTRRIKRDRIECGAWRAHFDVQDHVVTIRALAPGYPTRFLGDPDYDAIPDADAQRAFFQRWPHFVE